MSGNEGVAPILTPTRKSSLLPLLTVLFLVSYGLMTLLIIFQGATIQSQRNLILELLDDSRQLWAIKGKALQDRQAAQAAQADRHSQAPSSQAQAPSTQAPSVHAPSTQAVPQHRSEQHPGKTAKPQVQIPPKPAADLADQRRMLNTI